MWKGDSFQLSVAAFCLAQFFLQKQICLLLGYPSVLSAAAREIFLFSVQGTVCKYNFPFLDPRQQRASGNDGKDTWTIANSHDPENKVLFALTPLRGPLP